MTETPAARQHPEDLVAHLADYVRTFNSGDVAAIDAMYTADAISVWEPGKPLQGEARRAALVEFVQAGPRLGATLRESYVTRDTALVITDWTMDVPDGEGGEEHLSGIATDVLRRGADGRWKYAVDDPFGDPRNKL